MITKKTTPIFDERTENGKFVREVTGTQVLYRIFGVPVFKKMMYLPEHWRCKVYNNYQTRI